MTANSPEVVARECRFAFYCPGEQDSTDDLHVVKEIVHYADGTSAAELKHLRNFKRPFYITKKGRQNYQDFKEWENLDALDKFECRQRDLTDSVARALGKPWMRGGLRDLCQTPYIFGVDISSTSIIKHNYQARWDKLTPYTYSAFDTETDMIHGHGQVMMASITYKHRCYTAVQKSFVEGWSNPVERIKKLAEEHLADVIASRKLEIVVEIVDSEIECIKRCIAKAHEWKPDWLAVWNIEFDMDKIKEACDRAGVDPVSFMSDPSVPAEFRPHREWKYIFKKGPAKKVTASGRTLNFKPSQRWHSVDCPASFFWVDAMCAYRQVRTGAPEEQSYALNAILEKNKLKGKLKFKELEGEKIPEDGAEWHRFMQSKFPLHYVVYNIFDCVAMELLDEKVLDIQLSVPMFAGCTDFANFNSLPRKTMNELHWFCEKMQLIPGSTASEMAVSADEETTDVKGWIVMLPSHLVDDNGLKLILENPDLRTNIRTHVADLDVSAAYPTNEMVFNISKETTKKELIEIKDIDELTTRMQTINFSAGQTNAVEFCTTMYDMPTMSQLLEEYDHRNDVTSIESVLLEGSHPLLTNDSSSQEAA
jgi:hypothetical protein